MLFFYLFVFVLVGLIWAKPPQWGLLFPSICPHGLLYLYLAFLTFVEHLLFLFHLWPHFSNNLPECHMVSDEVFDQYEWMSFNSHLEKNSVVHSDKTNRSYLNPIRKFSIPTDSQKFSNFFDRVPHRQVISNLSVEWKKRNHARWGPRKLSILIFFLCFRDPSISLWLRNPLCWKKLKKKVKILSETHQ